MNAHQQRLNESLLKFGPIVLIIAVCFAIGWVVYQQAKLLPKQIRDEIKIDYLESKKKDIKDQVLRAEQKINYLFEPDSGLTVDEAKDIAKKILTEFRYNGEDGYIFVYDFEGTNIAHPIKTDWIGQNKWDYKDKNDKYVIRDLIKAALDGDGYDEYIFHKPSATKYFEDSGRTKLSYMIALKDIGWVLGTGVYMDEVEEFLDGIDSEVRIYIHDSIKWAIFITILGLAILSVVQVRIGQLIAQDKIARRLHSKVKQDLGYIVRELRKTPYLHKSDDAIKNDFYQNVIDNLKDSAENAFKNAINIIDGMDPDHPMLVDGLENAINDFEKRERIPVNFSTPKEFKSLTHDLPETKRDALIEVAQEALSNISKHAAAREVNMQLHVDACNITLTIQDNGIGFDADNVILGLGQHGMRAEMKTIKGTLQIFSTLGKGTTITACIPKNLNLWNYTLCLLKRLR